MKKVPGKHFWLLMTMTGALIFGAPALVSASEETISTNTENNTADSAASTGTTANSATARTDGSTESNSQEIDHSEEGQISKPKYLENAKNNGEEIISDENPTDNTYGYYTIMGGTTVSVDAMCSLYNSQGCTYPSEELGGGGAPDIETFCDIIVEEANAENVRGEVVFAQAMLETGWLGFGGDAGIDQFNFAGLGTTGNGVKGIAFPDVRTGIRAQVQHLKAYASTDDLNQECVDERFDYVTRETAPYVEWLGIQENPYGGGWAAGKDYGSKLRKILADLKSEA